jgi:hypothetical protein
VEVYAGWRITIETSRAQSLHGTSQSAAAIRSRAILCRQPINLRSSDRATPELAAQPQSRAKAPSRTTRQSLRHSHCVGQTWSTLTPSHASDLGSAHQRTDEKSPLVFLGSDQLLRLIHDIRFPPKRRPAPITHLYAACTGVRKGGVPLFGPSQHLTVSLCETPKEYHHVATGRCVRPLRLMYSV